MVKVLARAKINLSLHVTGHAAGGYHQIRTVMQSIDLADELQVTRASATHVEMEWAEGTGPIPQRPDLVERALDLYSEAAGKTLNTAVKVLKRIPIGAGLGGGSADAAAALVGMAAIQGAYGEVSLGKIAPQLGADVAFMLEGGCALAEGIGEKLTPQQSSHQWWVIVVPSRGLSTAEVYRRFDELEIPGVDHTEKILNALMAKDLGRLGVVLCNDLEGAAFDLYPELEELKADVINGGALGAVMSGSGSAIGGLFGSESAALTAGADLERLGVRALVTRSAIKGAEVLEMS